jgi:anti-sigma-K factor RskA
MNERDYILIQKYACGEATAEERKAAEQLLKNDEDAKRILNEFTEIERLLLTSEPEKAPANLNQNIMAEITKGTGKTADISRFYKSIISIFVILILILIGFAIYINRYSIEKESQFGREVIAALSDIEKSITFAVSADIMQLLASVLAFITAISLYMLIEKVRKLKVSTHS